MSFLAEARVLARMVGGMPRRADHAAALTGFYAAQAAHYDQSREKLLQGRSELFEALDLQAGETLVELGAGTGYNLTHLGPVLARLESATLVDLCPPLLAEARQRWAATANVNIVEADACTWQPSAPVDAVCFSYSLSMIPDWPQAIANALAMLRPGGRLGVADFSLAPDQSALSRHFWKSWFAHDGVRLNPEHPRTLAAACRDHRLDWSRTRLPWLGGLAVPRYLFVGVKND